MVMNSSMAKSGGMGFVSTLTLIFFVLKLLDLIAWPWVWVFSPLWISAGLFLVLLGIILVEGRIKKGKW